MAGMVSFRLGDDYLQRYDALAARLVLNRAQLVRNLLSLDPELIDVIEHKAKTLNQITLDESIVRSNNKTNDLITIRLDEEFVRRLDGLAASLGVNKVQVLRKLLSGDATLVSGVCKKAKNISLSEVKPSEAAESSISQQVEGCPSVPLSAIQQPSTQQVGINLFPGIQGENKRVPIKPKRAEKKKKNAIVSEENMEVVHEMVDYINRKTGKTLKPTKKTYIETIAEALGNGYTIEDFKKVVDNMTPQWLGSVKMNVRLNPATLFSDSYIDTYLNCNVMRPSRETENKGQSLEGEPLPKPNKYDSFYL